YAFHPSALQDDGRDLRKMIAACGLELQEALRLELERELQATSLRMDNALHRLASAHYDAAAAKLVERLSGINPPPYERTEGEAPDFGSGWTTDALDAKWLWGRFRSPRHFFEQGGRDLLRTELAERLEPGMQQWMEARIEAWSTFYRSAWSSRLAASAERLAEEVRSYAAGAEASLGAAVSPDTLRELKAQLQQAAQE